MERTDVRMEPGTSERRGSASGVTLEENPERHEQVIRARQLDTDPDIRKLLGSTYLEADRLQVWLP